MTRIEKTLIAATTAAMLTAGSAVAMLHADMDMDGDGMLNNEEFNGSFGERDRFGTYDADGDGMLTEDEFNTGVFSQYDRDGSGFLEEPELGDVGDDMGDEGFWDV